jgi:hypothetical protein
MKGDPTTITFQDNLFRLSLLAQTVYKWNGLPNGIDEKHLERYLFSEGRCMFYKDSKVGWIITKCADCGSLNYYDEPTQLRPVVTGNLPLDLEPRAPGKDCVLIYNNDLAYPTARTIMMYAARLTEIQRTIDINIHAQKTPVLIKASDKTRLSAKQVYAKWSGFEPLIITDKNLSDGVSMEALHIAAPIVFDKLAIEKNKLWNECMTFLGINNANMDKRERLVDDEVQANNEQIGYSAEVMLKSRQRAAEAMSELCGTEITVELRRAQKAVYSAGEGDSEPKEGGAA